MNRIVLFSLLWLMTTQAWAQKPQSVPSTIQKVTVFEIGAQVTRQAKLSLTAGKTELIFDGLSPHIDPKSLQVKGIGNFTILAVTHQTNFLREQQRREETQALENQSYVLSQQRQVQAGMLEVFKQEQDMLIKNQQIGGSQVGVKTADLKEAIEFQRARMSEILQKRLEAQRLIARTDSSLAQIARQLQALRHTQDFATGEVLVTVSAKQAATAVFELTYFVGKAGWFAHYDLRVQDIANPIDLSMKANIFQQSGEDWKEVKLAVSNANPTENGNAPTLNPWYLRFGHLSTSSALQGRASGVQVTGRPQGQVMGRVTDKDNQPLPGVNILVKGSLVGTVANQNGEYALNLPAGAQVLVFSFIGYKTQEVRINSNQFDVVMEDDVRQLDEVIVVGYSSSKDKESKKKFRKKQKYDDDQEADSPEVSESRQPTTMTFEVEIPYTILSNGKVYTVDLKTMRVPAQYEYFTIPKIEQAAYLTAKIIGWQDLNLLSGEVNLFFEEAFLGKSVLDVEEVTDTLDISLGKDRSIIVERKRLKEFSGKQFLSSDKVESRAYEITIRNNKPQPINIIVQDQLPISTSKDISIDQTEHPEATMQEDSKILTWKYELGAKQAKKHQLKYRVRYPKKEILVID